MKITTLPVRAAFNPLIRPYLVLQVGFSLAASIIGLPLALIWFLGVGQWWARHYFDRLECELGTRSLRFRKGILFQVEKTIPLENIQDVTFIEGPVLRHFNLAVLKFETAGHAEAGAHDMKLVGIIDAHAFRACILAARDALRHPPVTPPAVAASELAEIVHLLHRIADRLDALSLPNRND
jgi:putative membrane protein